MIWLPFGGLCLHKSSHAFNDSAGKKKKNYLFQSKYLKMKSNWSRMSTCVNMLKCVWAITINDIDIFSNTNFQTRNLLSTAKTLQKP